MYSNEILEICNDAIVDTDTMDVPFLEDGEMIVQCRDGMRYRITIEDITED